MKRKRPKTPETRLVRRDGTFDFSNRVYRALGVKLAHPARYAVGVRPSGIVYLHRGGRHVADALPVATPPPVTDVNAHFRRACALGAQFEDALQTVELVTGDLDGLAEYCLNAGADGAEWTDEQVEAALETLKVDA